MGDHLRSADVRFLLPAWPARVRVAGLDAHVARALVAAGHEVVADHAPADAALCTTGTLREVLRDGPLPCGVVVQGTGSDPLRALARAGLQGRGWLLLAGDGGPSVAVPARSEQASRAALLAYTGRQDLTKAVRNRLAHRALVAGLLPPRQWTAAVSEAADGASWPAVSGCAGSPGPAFLAFPGRDALSRVVAVLPAGRVVKLTRLPHADESATADLAGMLLAAGSPVARLHAPRSLGHGRLASPQGGPSLPWTAETLGVGESLTAHLQTRGGDRIALIKAIARWLRDLALSTTGPAGSLRPLLDGLHQETDAVSGEIPFRLDSTQELATVLSHDDLGCWNVVTDGKDWTVLDWEGARAAGLPLADLLYLLTDALGQRDGARSDDERLSHALRLHRGELPASALLFALVREHALALRIPIAAVPTLALACWLWHGRGTEQRLATARAAGIEIVVPLPPAAQLGRAWLLDPELRSTWEAFARTC